MFVRKKQLCILQLFKNGTNIQHVLFIILPLVFFQIEAIPCIQGTLKIQSKWFQFLAGHLLRTPWLLGFSPSGGMLIYAARELKPEADDHPACRYGYVRAFYICDFFVYVSNYMMLQVFCLFIYMYWIYISKCTCFIIVHRSCFCSISL